IEAQQLMKISTKGRYGLQVMMDLVQNYGRGPIPVETIAGNQEISGKYIHQIVIDLRGSGLVRTVRGPHGGYELARDPSSITVRDVVTALEGNIAPVDCVANMTFCSRAGQCAARDVWRDVASAIDGVLSGITMEQLSARQREKAEDAPNYCI
ncbi:MAG TPA: Rrf2 family transcriptional regulator, partial [Acidobacteriota bacterium]|nr:Rrf2 family transcriptional regulator [Acidobacteriota bacterium]